MITLFNIVLVVIFIYLFDFLHRYVIYLALLAYDKAMIFILLYELEWLFKETDKLIKELEILEEEDGVIKWMFTE